MPECNILEGIDFAAGTMYNCIHVQCLSAASPAWFWFCAIGISEPRQVRKEAAIRGTSYVPQTSLFQCPAELLKGIFHLMKLEN